MLNLGIDCSEFGVSVAIADDNLLIEKTINKSLRASQMLIPLIEDLFLDNKLSLKDVDKIIVAKGPGSFTGLKIGITCAKVLALTNDAKLVGVSSLANLVYPFLLTNRPVLALLDARHGNFYAAVYQKVAREVKPVLPDFYDSITNIVDKVRSIDNLLIVGSGIDKVAAEFPKLGVFIEPLIPRATDVISLANGLPTTDIIDFSPNYLRDPQAVINWQNSNPNSDEGHDYVEEI